MFIFIICEAPKIISAIFGPFLTIFSIFHMQFLLQSKNSQWIISGTPQFLIGLVNNAKNQCQKLINFFWLLNYLQRRCVHPISHINLFQSCTLKQNPQILLNCYKVTYTLLTMNVDTSLEILSDLNQQKTFGYMELKIYFLG